MPRARNIKHSFFSDDELGELTPVTRIFFIGLWTIADYKGDLEWRPKRIKAQLLPYDDCDVQEIAINLDQSGFIRFYSVQDKTYVNVRNFCAHQNPHKNERNKGSDIPKFTEDCRQVIDFKEVAINPDKSRLKPFDSQSDRADSCSLIPDSCSLIADSCTLIPDSPKTEKITNNIDSNASIKTKHMNTPTAKDYMDNMFDRFWNFGMRKANKQLAKKTFQKVMRQAGGNNPEGFLERLRLDIAKRNDLSQQGFDVLHPSSYLNAERWTDDYPKPPADPNRRTPEQQMDIDTWIATGVVPSNDNLPGEVYENDR